MISVDNLSKDGCSGTKDCDVCIKRCLSGDGGEPAAER